MKEMKFWHPSEKIKLLTSPLVIKSQWERLKLGKHLLKQLLESCLKKLDFRFLLLPLPRFIKGTSYLETSKEWAASWLAQFNLMNLTLCIRNLVILIHGDGWINKPSLNFTSLSHLNNYWSKLKQSYLKCYQMSWLLLKVTNHLRITS